MQFSDLDLSKTYCYADYLQWDFDERVELINGKIFQFIETPPSTPEHVYEILLREFYKYLENGSAVAYVAPFDIKVSSNEKNDVICFTIAVPGLCIVTDLTKILDIGRNTLPDIVIAILTGENNREVLKNLFEKYEKSGIAEYWIFSPSIKALYRYTLNTEDNYQASRVLTIVDSVQTPILPGFVLDLETVFADIP